MMLASELSLSIAIARLQVGGDSALDCLCRHFACLLGKNMVASEDMLRQNAPVKFAIDSSRVVGEQTAGK